MPQWRYLRGDRAGVLAARRAVTRDAKLDVWEAAERASALAVDFMHNSGWMAGAADQIITDTVGTELKLNARPDLSALGYTAAEQTALARIIESEWRRWAWNPRECDLAGVSTIAEMTDGVMRHYLGFGEAFGVLDYLDPRQRSAHGIVSGTKVKLVAPHRLPRVTREFEGLEQGIFLDNLERPTHYRFKRREGGGGLDVDVDIMARDVIHVMDRGLNPGSPRGISPMTPALKVAAQADQLADATLTTALMQAIFAATITSPEASEDAFKAIQMLEDTEPPTGIERNEWVELVANVQADLVEVWSQRFDALKAGGVNLADAARVAHLGPGEKLEFTTTETAGSQYLPFSQNLYREQARCLGITAESFTLDWSDATYTSSRMGVSSIWPIALRRRERVAAPFCQSVYEPWLEESIAEGRIPLRGGYQAFLANKQRIFWAEWRGPEQPTADPYKDALADKVKLETGATNLQRIYAAKGQDWEEELEQAGREIEKLDGIGMAAPHGRSTGGDGAGPNGAAADGRRDPARNDA
ncbi:phage portal protein [Tianweitania aestuarii]|uniref:phage portal protein n=1 Tax=Tianweitania aestuarii TaxID=2814886 RepID=UPI00326497DD